MQPWEHWHQDVIPRRTTRSREYIWFVF
jgi:hypothetical protein